ncbi:hypothetical protein ACTJIJ_22840 [Niabella sp. 22666]|uniref:hypothetical protein n=1 Tax=Niabella sp. 22666 TaxID=3453954 RepID=UPI003F869544
MSNRQAMRIIKEAERKILDETGIKMALCIDAGHIENVQTLLNPFLESWNVSMYRIQSEDTFRPLVLMRYILALYLRKVECLKFKVIATILNRDMTTLISGMDSLHGWLITGDEMTLKYYNKVKHLFDEQV